MPMKLVTPSKELGPSRSRTSESPGVTSPAALSSAAGALASEGSRDTSRRLREHSRFGGVLGRPSIHLTSHLIFLIFSIYFLGNVRNHAHRPNGRCQFGKSIGGRERRPVDMTGRCTSSA